MVMEGLFESGMEASSSAIIAGGDGGTSAVAEAELPVEMGWTYSMEDNVPDRPIGSYVMWQSVEVLTSTMKEGKKTYMPRSCIPMKPQPSWR